MTQIKLALFDAKLKTRDLATKAKYFAALCAAGRGRAASGGGMLVREGVPPASLTEKVLLHIAWSICEGDGV